MKSHCTSLFSLTSASQGRRPPLVTRLQAVISKSKLFFTLGWIAVLLAGCDRTNFTSVQSPPTPLIDAFQSYASIADVQAALKSKGLVWTTIEDSRLPAGDRRPQFDILKISVARYTYLGNVGEVHFYFFNNRLMGTWFFPEDAASFTSALKSVRITFRPDTSVPPFTRVWTHKNYQNRIYVAWEDTRLVREVNSWISSYS